MDNSSMTDRYDKLVIKLTKTFFTPTMLHFTPTWWKDFLISLYCCFFFNVSDSTDVKLVDNTYFFETMENI